MKRILTILVLCIASVSYADEISEKLKMENRELIRRIKLNNQMIKTREKSSINIPTAKVEKPIQRFYTVELGNEFIDWGYDFEGFAPRVGMTYTHDSLRIGGSYSRFVSNEFPGLGSQTIVNFIKVEASYLIPLNNNFTFAPKFSALKSDVSSPDAGIGLGDSYSDRARAELENDVVAELENKSGIYLGASVIGNLSDKWSVILNTDFSLSSNVNIAYRF